MSEDRPANYRPIIIGGIVEAVGGFSLLVYAYQTAIGVRSDTSITAILFPFPLAARTLDDLDLITLLIAFVQYPIYGVILGVVWSKARVGESCVMAWASVLPVGHGTAVGVAKHRLNATYSCPRNFSAKNRR